MQIILHNPWTENIELTETGLTMPMPQHATYGAVMRALGRRVRVARIMDGGRWIGQARIISRSVGPVQLSYMARGPAWFAAPDPEAQGHALRLIARQIGPFVATPESDASGAGLVGLMTPRHQAVIDLGSGASVLRAAMHGKWRNRLRRAEAVGLGVVRRIANRRTLDAALAQEAAQAETRGYRPWPARFTRAWLETDPAGGWLYEASWQGDCVARMLMLLHAPGASYHIGWADPEGRRMNAHNLLLWRAMRDLQKAGFTALDLGDVNTEDAPGLARFKIGSGARVAPLGATSLVLPSVIRRQSRSPAPSPRTQTRADGT